MHSAMLCGLCVCACECVCVHVCARSKRKSHNCQSRPHARRQPQNDVAPAHKNRTERIVSAPTSASTSQPSSSEHPNVATKCFGAHKCWYRGRLLRRTRAASACAPHTALHTTCGCTALRASSGAQRVPGRAAVGWLRRNAHPVCTAIVAHCGPHRKPFKNPANATAAQSS